MRFTQIFKFPTRFIASFTFLATLLLATSDVKAIGYALRQLDAKSRTEVGFYAVRLDTGEVLAGHRASEAMIPASVQKVVASAAAIELLGGDFEFETKLAIYQKKLIVIGDGDPLFGDPVLAAEKESGSIYDVMDSWADLLIGRGITDIEAIVLDDTVLKERRHPSWPKEQANRWYCAPVSGLNFHNNCLDVYVDFSLPRGVMRVSPQSSFINVKDRVRRRSGKNNIWHMSQSDDLSSVEFTGKAAKASVTPTSVSVDDPTMLFGRVLADRLLKKGIRFGGNITRAQVRSDNGSIPNQVTVLAVHKTKLRDVFVRMNKRSLSFMAECLLLRSSASAGGEGSYKDADRLCKDALVKRYGIKPAELIIHDGGGMSRDNRVSARAVVAILKNLAKSNCADAFAASLPIGGVDGTLKKRFRNYSGRVAAKTGTINSVRSLAGYILDSSGKPVIAFAAITNSLGVSSAQAKSAIDSFVTDMIQ